MDSQTLEIVDMSVGTTTRVKRYLSGMYLLALSFFPNCNDENLISSSLGGDGRDVILEQGIAHHGLHQENCLRLSLTNE